MKYTIDAGYKTGSGNKMPIWLHLIPMLRELVPVHDNPGMFCSQDAIDCKGFNGGCPPYAPRFGNVKKDLPIFYVVCLEFDMAGALSYAGWTRGRSAPGLFIQVYADRLTMNYIQRLLKYMEAKGLLTLGASNCPGCKPKVCTVTQGKKCSRPKKRRFSLEATGVQCDEIHMDVFDNVLPWWYLTFEHVPTSMFRYAGMFCSEKDVDDVTTLIEMFVKDDKSYVPQSVVPVLRDDFDVVQLIVPAGKPWEGEPYLAYRIPVERMEKWRK